MTYLERYTNGEYEQVWDELLALGTTVQEAHVYSDALAVAHETMRRARKNIEVLIQRLLHIDFVFGYDYFFRVLLSEVRSFRGWEAYFEMLCWAREQPPVFVPANLLKEALADEMNNNYAFELHPEEEEAAYRRAWRENPTRPPDMKHFLEQLEQDIGLVPLSVRAWYEEVGVVNFYGYHAGWNLLVRSFHPSLYQEGKLAPLSLMAYCDPLQVQMLDEKRLLEVHRYHQSGKPYELHFAPDRYRKDYQSGADTTYFFLLPDSGADAVLWNPFAEGQMTFVQYLRMALLQWAGFPGMVDWPTVPQEDLTFLTKGLIPF